MYLTARSKGSPWRRHRFPCTPNVIAEPYAGEQQRPNDYNAQKKTKHADLPPMRSGRGFATRARPASLGSVEAPAPPTLARIIRTPATGSNRGPWALVGRVASLALNRRPRASSSHIDAILLCPRGGRAHKRPRQEVGPSAACGSPRESGSPDSAGTPAGGHWGYREIDAVATAIPWIAPLNIF